MAVLAKKTFMSPKRPIIPGAGICNTRTIRVCLRLMFDLESHEKEGFMYILGVPLLIVLILSIAFLTHFLLTP